MAVYKVPQDVEADDKLIGPFSFRQFIYLIIVAVGIFVAYMLGKLFIGLIIIPLPIIVFFGALALPLRKDQPMEVYLTAVIKFFLKPKVRLWNPDGSINMVTITAPEKIEYQLTKDFNSNEAEQRLSYLAQIVDTKGWSSRGVTSAPNLTDTVAAEAQTAEDVFDETGGIGHSFDSLIEQQDAIRKQMVMNQFQHAAQQPQAVASSAPIQTQSDPVTTDTSIADDVVFNPYPSSMHQHVLQPVSRAQSPQSTFVVPAPQPVTQQPQTTSQTQDNSPVTPAVSPDILRLANNNDLSISAIAREAHRLDDKDNQEVVISLR